MSLKALTHSLNLRDVVTLLALTRCRGVSGLTALRLALGHERHTLIVAGAHPDLGQTLKPREIQTLSAILEDQTLDKARRWAKEELERHRAIGARVIGFFDPDYPLLLRLIPRPPPVLFVRGNLGPLLTPRLTPSLTSVSNLTSHDVESRQDVELAHPQPLYAAVIGTRHPSDQGMRRAQDVVHALFQNPTSHLRAQRRSTTVISGLALGTDGYAHQTTLEHDGYTVAVLGHGLDQRYPYQHMRLTDQILTCHGALISEQPIGTAPHPYCLVARDRIQAGLSAGVIITETGPKGGSLHTARSALKQERSVYLPADHRLMLRDVEVFSDPKHHEYIFWINHQGELAEAVNKITHRSLELHHQAHDLYEALKRLSPSTYAQVMTYEQSSSKHGQGSLFS